MCIQWLYNIFTKWSKSQSRGTNFRVVKLPLKSLNAKSFWIMQRPNLSCVPNSFYILIRCFSIYCVPTEKVTKKEMNTENSPVHTKKKSFCFLCMMLMDSHKAMHKAIGAPGTHQKTKLKCCLFSLTGNDTPKSQFDWRPPALVLYHCKHSDCLYTWYKTTHCI